MEEKVERARRKERIKEKQKGDKREVGRKELKVYQRHNNTQGTENITGKGNLTVFYDSIFL